MINVIGFETRRVFSNRINIAFMILFLLVTLIFVQIGTNDYKELIKSRSEFLSFEKEKVSRYLTYDQYGGFGFYILFEPSPMIIFFDTHKILKSLKGNIDTLETMKIIDIYKGRSLFFEYQANSFSGILFLFGSLYMAGMGLTLFKNMEFIKKWVGNKKIPIFIATRLILLLGYFLVVHFINILLVEFNGIHLSNYDLKNFLLFFLYATLFLSLFFAAGILIALLFKSKKVYAMFVFWFFLILCLPIINSTIISNDSNAIPNLDSLDITKIEVLMEAEKRIDQQVQAFKDKTKDTSTIWKPYAIKYWEETSLENTKREMEFHKEVTKVFKKIKNRSAIFPSLFFNYLSSELSSKGYDGYDNFFVYIHKIRASFLKFYVNKRYKSNEKKIESFIKADENIYKAESKLPGNYWQGLALTALYSFILFLGSLLVIRRRLNVKLETVAPPERRLNEGEMYFGFCELPAYMDKLFNYYQLQPNTTCIDMIDGDDIDPGMRLDKTVDYYCQLKGTNPDCAREWLEHFGLTDLKKAKRTAENLRKLYIAVCISSYDQLIVFKDVIKDENRSFEKGFLYIISQELKNDRTILYLGTEVFQNVFGGMEIPHNKEVCKIIPIDEPTMVILR